MNRFEQIIALHRFTDTEPGFLAAISHQGLEIDLVRYLEGVPSPPVAARHEDRNGTAKMADFACASNCLNGEPMPSPNRSSTSLQRRKLSGFPTFFLQLRVVWLGKRHIFHPEALIPLPSGVVDVNLHILRDLLAVHMPKRRKSSRRHPEYPIWWGNGGMIHDNYII